MAQAQAPNGQMNAQQLIDTVLQLQQGVQQGQQREAQLRQQIDALVQAGQEAQQREQQVRAQVETLTQQLHQQQQTLVNFENMVGAAFNNLAASQRQFMDSLRNEGLRNKVTLFDTKGLARPDRFEGKEELFLHWRTKLEAFVTSVYPEMEQVLTWAEEEENEIDAALVLATWGPTNPTQVTIDGIEAMCSQLHAVLQSLCENEAFSIVRSSGRGNGAEAWRKLVKRYDPSTGSRRRAMLKHVLSAQRVQKIEDLSHAIEKWEEALRLYEGRKRADGSRHVLDNEIKSSVLESICPTELERHLQLNRSRYVTYDDVKAEITLFLESRLGSRMKISDSSGAAPMDVGNLGKGKGKGKKGKEGGKKGGSKGKTGKGGQQSSKGKGPGNGSNAGKETRACHNCGKTGHLQKDCWRAGGGAANKNQQPKNNNAKGPNKGSGKKNGKGVGNLEQQEPEAEAAETGFLSIAGLDEVKPEEPAENDSDFVTVVVESDNEVEFGDFDQGSFTMVKSEKIQCSDPCGCCMTNQCTLADEVVHYEHRCNDCDEARQRASKEASKEDASKTAIRNDTKWRLPESFHFIVDKTICLTKGISAHVFNSKTEDEKDKLRNIHDPLSTSRDNNPGTLKQIEHQRNDMRVAYFEKLSEALIHGASRTFRSDPTPGLGELSQPSGLAELPSRQIGATSSNAMHRTIEVLEISTIDAEKRDKYQELEEVETEEGRRKLEEQIAELDRRKTALKEKIRENDKKAKQTTFKLTKESVLDQSWHDARYHAAIKAGATHSQAWAQEKKRRRATLHRKSGMPERTAEKLRLDAEWHAEFDSKKVKAEEFEGEHTEVSGVETEAVVEKKDTIQVLTGKTKEVKRGKLKSKDQGTFMKSAKKYRALTQDEVKKFTQETKEDEKRVMRKSRVNILKKRLRPMDASKKHQRCFRAKQARKLKREKIKRGRFLRGYALASRDPSAGMERSARWFTPKSIARSTSSNSESR